MKILSALAPGATTARADLKRSVPDHFWTDLLAVALAGETALRFLLRLWLPEAAELALLTSLISAWILLQWRRAGCRGLLYALWGTWIQRSAVLLTAVLMLSAAWGDHSLRSVLSVSFLPVNLVVAAMVAEALTRNRPRRALAWVMLTCVTLLCLLTLLEYYLGHEALGLNCGETPRCAQYNKWWHDTPWPGFFAVNSPAAKGMSNPGVSVTAHAYGTVRLAAFCVLAFALGAGLLGDGLLGDGRRRDCRLLAGLMMTLIVMTLLLLASRSGVFGLALASLCLTLAAARAMPRPAALRFAAALLSVLTVGTALALAVPAGNTIFDRIARIALEQRLTESLTLGSGGRTPAPGGGDGSALVYRIDGLDAGREYRVQLRALDRNGRVYNAWPAVAVAELADADAAQAEYHCGTGCGILTVRWRTAQSPDRIAQYYYRIMATDSNMHWPPWIPYTPRHDDAVRSDRADDSTATPLSLRLGFARLWAISDAERIRNWRVAWALFQTHPLWGSGYRTFAEASLRDDPTARSWYPHNGYLLTLSESGIAGLLSLSLLLLCCFITTLKRRHAASGGVRWWRDVFLIMLGVLLALNLVDDHIPSRYFWIVVGAVASIEIEAVAGRRGRQCPPTAAQ